MRTLTALAAVACLAACKPAKGPADTHLMVCIKGESNCTAKMLLSNDDCQVWVEELATYPEVMSVLTVAPYCESVRSAEPVPVNAAP